MKALILDAFLDSLAMLPFLFVIYFLVELLEFKYGSGLRSKVAHTGKWGPFVGSLMGCFPQCGFSVIGAGLYTRRLVTIGTLVAIFLATSDEAIPVILAQPEHINVVLPLIATKFVLGVFFGYFLDMVLFRKQQLAKHEHEPVSGDWPDCKVVNVEQHGCCGHHVAEQKNKSELFIHPLKHTLSVFFFILECARKKEIDELCLKNNEFSIIFFFNFAEKLKSSAIINRILDCQNSNFCHIFPLVYYSDFFIVSEFIVSPLLSGDKMFVKYFITGAMIDKPDFLGYTNIFSGLIFNYQFSSFDFTQDALSLSNGH